MFKTLLWAFLSAEAIVGAALTSSLLIAREGSPQVVESTLLGIGALFLVIALVLKIGPHSRKDSRTKDSEDFQLPSMNLLAVGYRKTRAAVARHRVPIQWASAGIVLLLNAWLVASFDLGHGI